MDNNKTNVLAENFLIVLILSLILPFLILFLFINPSPEDFYFANEAKLFNLWTDLRIQYKHTTGRYFQIILLYLTPLNDSPFNLYKAVCFFFMLLFYYAVFLYVKLVSGNILSQRENILISLIILFLYLYAMPQVSSGFYWYGGLTAYHSGIILISLFFLSHMLFRKAKKRSQFVSGFIILVLLIIAIEGSNEILAILFFIFIMIQAIRSFMNDKKNKWTYPVFAAVASISFYKLVTSPANSVRSALFPGSRDFMYSFVNTFSFLGEKIFSWVFFTPLLLFTVFLIPVFSAMIRRKEINLQRWKPFWTLLFWFGILFISTFISFYSTIVVLDRTLNMIYLFFLAGWFLNAFVIYDFIQKKYKISFEKYAKVVYMALFVLILFYLIKENNVTTAFSDLATGKAYNLNKQLNERFEIIKQNPDDSIAVDSLLNIPQTNFYKGLSSDPSNLSTQWYGKYFNKKTIYLKRSDTLY